MLQTHNKNRLKSPSKNNVDNYFGILHPRNHNTGLAPTVLQREQCSRAFVTTWDYPCFLLFLWGFVQFCLTLKFLLSSQATAKFPVRVQNYFLSFFLHTIFLTFLPLLLSSPRVHRASSRSGEHSLNPTNQSLFIIITNHKWQFYNDN